MSATQQTLAMKLILEQAQYEPDDYEFQVHSFDRDLTGLDMVNFDELPFLPEPDESVKALEHVQLNVYEHFVFQNFLKQLVHTSALVISCYDQNKPYEASQYINTMVLVLAFMIPVFRCDDKQTAVQSLHVTLACNVNSVSEFSDFISQIQFYID